MAVTRVAQLVNRAVRDTGILHALSNDPTRLRSALGLSIRQLAALTSASVFPLQGPATSPGKTGPKIVSKATSLQAAAPAAASEVTPLPRSGGSLLRAEGSGEPDISVLIPVRNERSRIAATIEAIARARTTEARVEFVVVDDASTDGCLAQLIAAVPRLLEERRINIRVYRLAKHSGHYRARNQAAALASGEILFITDAHVKFSEGWDERILRHVRPNRILAGTVTQQGTFRGYGCRLLVPLMGTSWNQDRVRRLAAAPVAACSATVIPRALFHHLGGYDPGMIVYGAGEPEFSVRAWLHGAEIRSLPELEIEHDFRSRKGFSNFLAHIRLYWVHNSLRFGLLYLSELGCLQMLAYYARGSRAVFQPALELVDASDIWERRATLEKQRQHSFDWFVNRFELKNQIGGEII